MLLPVILAGGSGTRLWPLSRKSHPKQFLNLGSKLTLLQETLVRLQGLNVLSPILIANEEHRFLLAEQIRQIDIKNPKILLEPVGRNTAPAIALAALTAKIEGDDPIMLVLAADHHIANPKLFIDAIKTATVLAEKNKLVTFGIVPNKPETGYGYIKQGAPLYKNSYTVECFIEKPDLDTAKDYLDNNNYLWNSGMFMFKSSVYLQALKKHCPTILAACEDAIQGSKKDLDFIRVDVEAFTNCPSKSIDYAVMENTSSAAVVPLDAGWSDIGSWATLWETVTKDFQGNFCQGDTLLEDTYNSLVFSDSKLVATLGLDNIVIVETKDALLVANKERSQEVRKIVDRLQEQGRDEHLSHRVVYRPWGMYDSVDTGKRYQVKRITVKPGAKLSMQMHHHRAEHWIVVSGTAKATVGKRIQLVTENESIYIPLGVSHCLENPGKIPLEVIEVQSGSYLNEDDIVRFNDIYGRD